MERLYKLVGQDKGKLLERKLKVLGIDLGTTNSCVVEICWDPQAHNDIVANCLEIDQYTREGPYTDRLVTSVVALVGDKCIVGEGAKQLRSAENMGGLKEGKNLFFETKNDIGISKTYLGAPKGYRSAAEIGGHILRFLYEASIEENPDIVDRIVLTVPASFQLPQRDDTLKAGYLAGLEIADGDLLDEPVAAFITYLVDYANEELIATNPIGNYLVFDFGGGTCDIAILSVRFTPGSGISVDLRQVSRYHRLGGGDIDRSIIYDILIPQLEKQNSLDPFNLKFTEKKRYIEPALLNVAEALKIKICSEIRRRIQFDKYSNEDKDSIKTVMAGSYTCKLPNRELVLQSPELTATQFEQIMEPFLDNSLLFARETEYYMTCSIFAPITDALDRCGFKREDIDYCLLVGGSSQIPQVVSAVGDYFLGAKILQFPIGESNQIGIAKGAAYHALTRELFGRGLVQMSNHDPVYILTRNGSIQLLKEDVELPYPKEGWEYIDELVVPETVLEGNLDIRFEVVIGVGVQERKLLIWRWTVPGPVYQGQPIYLKYRYNSNQVFQLRASLQKDVWPDHTEIARENPLSNVVNPQPKRERLYRIEEEIRSGRMNKSQQLKKLEEVADLNDELGQLDKAIEVLANILRSNGEADAYLLNKMGILSGRRKDYQGQQKYYREAARVTSWSGPLFNLALAQREHKDYEEALDSIDRALMLDHKMPALVLKAQIVMELGDKKLAQELLVQAMDLVYSIEGLNDWELGWYQTGASMLGKKELVDATRIEQSSRKKSIPAEQEGLLPMERRGGDTL